MSQQCQAFAVGMLWLLAGACQVVSQSAVVNVSTPLAFQAAAQQGTWHIILKDHMDLRGLPADPISSSNSTMIIKSSTKSIRGDCAGAPLPAGIALDPPQTAAGQCVVVVATRLMEVQSAASVLLSDVYIVLDREPPEADAPPLTLIAVSYGDIWLARCVLRGDGSNCRGAHIGNLQRLHGNTCHFVGFEAEDSAAVRCEAGSRAGFKGCTFNTNAARYHGSCVGLQSGNAGDVPAAAWFQSCIFSSNQDSLGYPISQSDARASHYSNRAFQKSVDASTGNLIEPGSIVAAQLIQQRFLIANFSTYEAIAEEQSRLTGLDLVAIGEAAVDVESEDEAPGDRSDGISKAAIAGIFGSVLAILLLTGAVSAIYVVREKRKRRLRSKRGADYGEDEHVVEISEEGTIKGVEVYTDRATVSPSSVETISPPTTSTHWVTDAFVTKAIALSGSPPTSATPIPRKLEYLHAQLSSVGEEAVVLERYTLLGPNHRRQGGQGVVAFAKGVHDDLGYALKFFVDRPSFLAERDMYRSKTLGRLLPQVQAEYDPVDTPKALTDSRGNPLPPCIVMERGESLPDWSKRARPDVFNAVAVLAHVATRLRDMHDGGWVHRDVKPENLMLLPRANKWTVIDFGCAARAGEAAVLSYTLVYAAPEVAAAVAAGERSIVAAPAMDAWALGVVAFELLTGQSVFNLVTEGRDSVLGKLLGREELPWEGDLAAKNPDARRRLGLFRDPVLSLLQRNPAQRATLADFCRTVNTVFSSPTTVGPA